MVAYVHRYIILVLCVFILDVYIIMLGDIRCILTSWVCVRHTLLTHALALPHMHNDGKWRHALVEFCKFV